MQAKTLFEKAVEDSKTLRTNPSNETQLKLYALYQQATIGDVNAPPPKDALDFLGKAQYEAWKELKGKTKKEAEKEYISLVNKLKN